MRADCRICDPSAGVVEISRTSRGTAIALSDRLGDDVSSSSRDWRVTMSEERFDRIDQALAHVGAGLENVNHNMHVLHDDVNGLHDNVRGLHDDMHGLHDNVRGLHDDMHGLHDNVRGLHDDVHGLHDNVRGLHDDMHGLHDNVRGLHDDVHGLHDNVRGLHDDMHVLHDNMRGLHDDVHGLHDNVRGLHDDVHVLRHDMHVLHEDALSRIAAVAESVVVLDQKMERGFAEVKETIRAEIVPLKAAVRHHATEIEKLKNARG
jgi:uncharacterized protein YoxC